MTRLLTNRYATELALLAAGYLFYSSVKHFFIPSLETHAYDNARKVIDLELTLNLLWEQTIQSWLLESHRNVVVFFNWSYTLGFFPILVPAALFLFLFKYKTYVLYRNIFLISFVFTWLMYLTFPVAPPRLMAEYGYVDTIEAMGPAIYNSKDALPYFNQYSAMPSMHFGWTLLFGMVFLRSRFTPLRLFGVVYPGLSFLSIIVTGNHYFLDAIVGGLIIVGSYGIYLLLRNAALRPVLQPVRVSVLPVLGTLSRRDDAGPASGARWPSESSDSIGPGDRSSGIPTGLLAGRDRLGLRRAEEQLGSPEHNQVLSDS